MDANVLMRDIYSISKRLEEARELYHVTPFNNTEMLMMREIVVAKQAGKRLISSRLAEILKITRSAVSQIVNKLEQANVVRRVPDVRDRKIAYVELTEEAYGIYESVQQRVNRVLDGIIAQFGEERVERLMKDASEFVDAFNGAVRAEEGACARK